MWSLGGVPAGHVYTEECNIKSLFKKDGEIFASVSYEGYYYKDAKIQNGILMASGKQNFGRFVKF